MQKRQATIEALAALYQRRYHRFLRVAEAITGDPESAHDAVQDAFARAIRGRKSFRGEAPLEGWVWQIVVNAARTARRARPLLTGSAEDVVDGRAATPDGELRALVAGLPERQRLVLFLRYYADLDYRAIADVLAIQPGTVGATLNQAHAALRRLIEEVPT